MITGKIGVGIVSCNRNNYLIKCLESLNECKDKFDYCVLVNDGKDKFNIEDYTFINSYIHNEKNLGVGKSKNILLIKLLENGCENLFIIEDDTIIKDGNVFNEYIRTALETNIPHLSYGPGSPLNLKQNININIFDRDKLNTLLEPDPKLTIEYKNDVKIQLYHHSVGMFCYFNREVLEDVGLIDETYYNVWEHVDHTFQIINKGYNPPFWWFADIADSNKYLSPVDEHHIKNSIIAKDPKWSKNVDEGMQYFIKKNGLPINQISQSSEKEVIDFLKYRKNLK